MDQLSGNVLSLVDGLLRVLQVLAGTQRRLDLHPSSETNNLGDCEQVTFMFYKKNDMGCESSDSLSWEFVTFFPSLPWGSSLGFVECEV